MPLALLGQDTVFLIFKGAFEEGGNLPNRFDFVFAEVEVEGGAGRMIEKRGEHL